MSKTPTSEINSSLNPNDISAEQKSGDDNPSYVKLAMRNMVKKGGKSLFHFSLSALGLLALFVGLAYLTR